jgi:hypothetical protein
MLPSGNTSANFDPASRTCEMTSSRRFRSSPYTVYQLKLGMSIAAAVGFCLGDQPSSRVFGRKAI